MSLNIRPFRALRAKNHLVKKVVMPAFDNLNAEDISKIIKNSKWNFLNVISPEAFYPGISKKLSKKHSLDHLSAMIDEKIIDFNHLRSLIPLNHPIHLVFDVTVF